MATEEERSVELPLQKYAIFAQDGTLACQWNFHI